MRVRFHSRELDAAIMQSPDDVDDFPARYGLCADALNRRAHTIGTEGLVLLREVFDGDIPAWLSEHSDLTTDDLTGLSIDELKTSVIGVILTSVFVEGVGTGLELPRVETRFPQ